MDWRRAFFVACLLALLGFAAVPAAFAFKTDWPIDDAEAEWQAVGAVAAIVTGAFAGAGLLGLAIGGAELTEVQREARATILPYLRTDLIFVFADEEPGPGQSLQDVLLRVPEFRAELQQRDHEFAAPDALSTAAIDWDADDEFFSDIERFLAGERTLSLYLAVRNVQDAPLGIAGDARIRLYISTSPYDFHSNLPFPYKEVVVPYIEPKQSIVIHLFDVRYGPSDEVMIELCVGGVTYYGVSHGNRELAGGHGYATLVLSKPPGGEWRRIHDRQVFGSTP